MKINQIAAELSSVDKHILALMHNNFLCFGCVDHNRCFLISTLRPRSDHNPYKFRRKEVEDLLDKFCRPATTIELEDVDNKIMSHTDCASMQKYILTAHGEQVAARADMILHTEHLRKEHTRLTDIINRN